VTDSCGQFARSIGLPGRNPRHIGGVRTLLIRLTACAGFAAIGACGGAGKTPPRADVTPWPQIRSDYRVDSLRIRLQEYSITFAADVDLAATAIEQRSADAAVRRNALLWRLRAVAEMRKACFRAGPLSGLVDAWTLTRQMDQLFVTGSGAKAFGQFQPEAVEVSRRLVTQMQEIASSIAVSPEARDQLERDIVDPWVATHPLPDMTFVRESPVARFAEQAQARGDVFQSVGSMEQLLQSLAQQARIYLADLPKQVRGELDLLRADVLPTDTLASAQGDLHASAAAIDRLAATAESMPALVRGERQAVLEEMNQQRALVMAAITTEREQAMLAMANDFALERNQLLREVEAQRLATLQWATGERRETIGDVRRDLAGAVSALRAERGAFTDDVRHLIDVVLLRMALFVIAGVVLAPLVAHAYARVWPRKKP
jgi:hypothetical protein